MPFKHPADDDDDDAMACGGGGDDAMRCLLAYAYGLWPRLVQRKREGHCVPIVNGFVLFLGCLIVQKKGKTLGALRRHPSVVW